jgi:hypothetical protein
MFVQFIDIEMNRKNYQQYFNEFECFHEVVMTTIRKTGEPLGYYVVKCQLTPNNRPLPFIDFKDDTNEMIVYNDPDFHYVKGNPDFQNCMWVSTDIVREVIISNRTAIYTLIRR